METICTPIQGGAVIGQAIYDAVDSVVHTPVPAQPGDLAPLWIWIILGVAATSVVGVGAYLVGKRQVARQ